MDSNIPHEATVAGLVNEPAKVTLYDEGGRSIEVPEADVAHWLERGFSREEVDIVGLAVGLKAQATAVAEAYELLVEETQLNSAIATNGAAMIACRTAVQEFSTALTAIERGLSAQFDVVQAPDDESEEESE